MQYPQANPVGIDKAIQSVAVALDALPWLQKSFGRAYKLQERQADGGTIATPKVFRGENFEINDYENVFPNDEYAAFSFIHVYGDELYELEQSFGAKTIGKTREAALIFWVNYEKTGYTLHEIQSEILKRDVERILLRIPYIQKILKFVDEEAGRIYDGFDLEEAARYRNSGVNVTQWLMYPFGGMRFELLLSYTDNC